MNKRYGGIDFWKFVFSVVVVSFHAFRFKPILGVRPFLGGYIAVEFFYLVSGYLMAQSANKNNTNEISLGNETRRFMFRKIKGLFPEFAVAWVIGFIVIHTAQNTWMLKTVVKDFLTGLWELFFLRMSGLSAFHANGVTWYISAMLLAMLILYPLLIKYKDTFTNIIAPCLTIFLLGYMCKEFETLGLATTWEGFYYHGLMRAFAELSLGCILWKIVQKMKEYQYTVLARILFSIVELAGYAFCIYCMFDQYEDSRMGFVLLMFFAISVSITFAHVGIAADLFDNKFCYFLGKISYPLYIGHTYWVKNMDAFFPEYSAEKQTVILVGLLIATVSAIMIVSALIRKITPTIAKVAKKIFIVT